jgi:protein-tyrosine phosphatase
MEQSDFLERRAHAYQRLYEAVQRENLPIRLILGAEVAFTASLSELNLDALCYEVTRTILVELPWDYYPPYAREVFYRLMLNGYRPLIAHVERYHYLWNKPHLLEELVQGGALAQVNTSCLIRGGSERKRVLRMISDGIVHVLASDTHSMENRPPTLGEAVGVVEKKLGSVFAQELVNGLGLFN